MSFGDDNFLFNICSENMFNEDNSILGLINGNSSISILFDLENEEKTNFFNEDDDHYFLNDNNNNSVNNNVKNNDNNNIINNSSNHNNINKNNNNNNNNNVKNQLELEDKTKETTNIVRNNNTQKEIPENDKLLNKKRENTDSNSEKCSRFSSDNTIRKIKHIILDSLLKFINEKIKTIYNNNIGYGVLQKNYSL